MKRTLSVLLILLGAALILGPVSFVWYNQTLANPDELPIPPEVAGETLLEQSSGKQAVEEINNLHSKEFKFRAAAVGVYGEAAKAVVWVSQTGLPWQGKAVLMDMHESITESDTPFTATGHTEIDGHIVYTLEGLGQLHYYWQSGDRIIWLSADAELAETALQQCLAFYK